MKWRAAVRPVLACLVIICAATLTAQEQATPDALPATPVAEADDLWAQGRFDEAEQIYTRELDLNATSGRARFGVARALSMRTRLDEAMREVNEALVHAPKDAGILGLQGHIFERLHRYPEAAAAYQAAVVNAPDQKSPLIGAVKSRIALLKAFRRQQPVEIQGDPLGSYTVPFTLVKNKVTVRGKVNGTLVDFVLDTGSERTTISGQIASRANVYSVGTTLGAGVGAAGITAMGIGRADNLEIGKMKIRRVPVSIRQSPRWPRMPRWEGEIFSPVPLGLSTIVDYDRREVTFTRRLPPPVDDPGVVRLPLRVYQLPLVRGVLNASHPTYFVVDTGGELISINVDTALALNMTASRHIPLRVFGTSGMDSDAFLLPGVDVAFDQIQFRNFGVAVLNLRAPSALLGFQVGGILGHRFLEGHTVTIDLERSELRLKKS